MRFRKDHSDEIQSILAEGVEFQGELAFSHGLRVDGIVRGKVRADACLFIGPTGKVEADVSIKRAMINGEFRGALRAAERVEIHKDGKVYGEIFTPCLIIEAGATFDGKCRMSEEKAASALPQRSATSPDTAGGARTNPPATPGAGDR